MKKKLSLFTLFLVMPFVIFGAIQIWWYSQAPHATSVNDTDIMLVERPVPHTNLWFNMAQLRSYTSTGITNLTVSNAYITNIYVITGAVDNITVTNGITNLSLTANTVLKADANKRISSILPNVSGVLTNDGAGNVGFFPVTSLGVPNPWTNNTDFTWLSGFTMATNGAPQTAPFSIWTNASFFVGPDVFQDIAQDPTTVHFPYAVLLTDSNGPNALQFSFNVYDSLAGSAFSKWFSTVSPSQSSATYENSIHNDKLSWRMQTVSEFDFSTNTVSIFHIDNEGLTTANGYVDTSGNVGDLVAYGTAGRLVSTNVTAIISGLTNIQQNFATTNNSSTLTNIISSIASNAVPVQTNFSLASITNLFFTTAMASTNHWNGPTNDVDLKNGNDQYFTAATPVSITGFVNKETKYDSSVVLTVTNSAATNVTLYLPAGVVTDDGLSSYIITNGLARVTSIRYSPVGYTQAVSRLFPGAPSGNGTVTSVGASGPGGFSWSAAVTGSGTLTATTPGLVLTNGESQVVTLSNLTVLVQTHYRTNLATMAPDFSVGSEAISTNASFTFLAPINISPTNENTVVMTVINTLGTPIQVTMPNNVHLVPGSVPWITNKTKFTFNWDGETNCYAVPVW